MGDMEWIVLAQNKDRWLALMNVVMHLRFPHNVGNIWLPVNLLASDSAPWSDLVS